MKTKLLTLCLLIPLFGMSQFQLIKDINPGANSSDPDSFFQFNGNIYFSAKDSGPDLIFLSDGTTSGTSNLSISGGVLASPYVQSSVSWLEFNNELYFSGFDGTSFDIFKNDGNANGNVRVTNSAGALFDSGLTDTPIRNLVAYNSEIYFSGEDGTVGDELRKVDASSLGYTIVKDIAQGTNNSNPRGNVVINNRIVFAASPSGTAGTTGRELWYSDGTDAGTQLLLDINPGPSGSFPSEFTVFNNKLYFVADDDNGRELWTTDGTTAGTYKVDDLNGNLGSNPQNLTVYDNQLVFSIVASSAIGREPAKMNAAENISTLGNINPGGADSNPTGFKEHNGLLYFAATGPNGRELYSTNGNQTSTALVTDINMSGDSNPEHLVSYGGLLFFAAEDALGGVELWSYDDNTTMASLTQDLNTSGSSNPIPRFVYNNQLILTADNGTTGNELWSYTLPQFLTFVPDDDFEQLLINQGYDNALDDFVLTSNISGLTTLNLNAFSGFSITDFTGLEDFSSLESLLLSGHNMISLDLTSNSSLTILSLGENSNLTNVNINSTDNPNLQNWTSFLNGLTSVQLDGFNNLIDFDVLGEDNVLNVDITNCGNVNLSVYVGFSNNFSSINLNGSNPRQLALEALPVFNAIDLSSLTNLQAFIATSTALTSLDLSQNGSLINVNVRNNNLTSLNIKNANNAAITSFNATDNTNLNCIEVDDESAANAGTGVYTSWNKDMNTVYSEDCATLSIDAFNGDVINLYPSPVKNSFSIDGNNETVNTVSIYDINGRLVTTFKGYQNSYDVNYLKSGIYIVKVDLPEGTLNQKIIKE